MAIHTSMDAMVILSVPCGRELHEGLPGHDGSEREADLWRSGRRDGFPNERARDSPRPPTPVVLILHPRPIVLLCFSVARSCCLSVTCSVARHGPHACSLEVD